MAGTWYWIVAPNAGWTDPSGAQIVARQNGGGSAASADGNFADSGQTSPLDAPVAAAGLAASTNYKLAWVWYDGTTYSNVAVSSAWSTLSAGVSLAAINVSQAHLSPTGAVSQVHALAAGSGTQAHVAGAGAITQGCALAGANAAQAHLSPTGAVSQAHALAAAAGAQAHAAGTGAIAQGGALAGASASQAHLSPSGAISQAHALAAAGGTQAHTAGTGAIAQGATVALAAASAAQAAQSAAGVIAQTHVLIAAASSQDAIADASAIVQAHLLAAAAAAQAAVGGAGAIVLGMPPSPRLPPLERMRAELAAARVARRRILESQEYVVGNGAMARRNRRADLEQVSALINNLNLQIAATEAVQNGRRRVLYIR